MASVSEALEYSAPSKRIKLDVSEDSSYSKVNCDFDSSYTLQKNVHKDVCEGGAENSEVLNNGLVKSTTSAECSKFCKTDVCVPSSSKIPDTTADNEWDSNCEGNEDNEKEKENEEEEEEEEEEGGGDGDDEIDDDDDDEEEDDDDEDEDDDDDNDTDSSSSKSSFSEIDADFLSMERKPVSGILGWVQKRMFEVVDPRRFPSHMLAEGFSSHHIPPHLSDLTQWKILVMREPPHRQKLPSVNSLEDVVRLLQTSNRIIVLTGAGVSVSCGIPDFRSRDGIYSRLSVDFPNLPDPQAMFDIHFFRQDPRPFFKFAREIYPGQFKPSPCHRFIKMLEDKNKLLRNYSQNIDTLEQVAGIQNVVQCHGSFATASCTNCSHKLTADKIREDIFAQRIPLCPVCNTGTESSVDSLKLKSEDLKDLVWRGIMKPDIVFFGEILPDKFHDSMADDKDECDLLIVIGSSLKVRPVSLIPSSLNPDIPQILINREPLNHLTFDIELLGDSDVIINQLCCMLGDTWSDICWKIPPLVEASSLLPHQDCESDDSSSWKINHLYGDCGHRHKDKHSGCSSDHECEKDDQSTPMSAVESSEADSLQMSIDSGMGMSGDSSCSTGKERHMSVDSSTRDSGMGFSPLSDVQPSTSGFNPDIEAASCSRDTEMFGTIPHPDSSSSVECDKSEMCVESSRDYEESSEVCSSEKTVNGCSIGRHSSVDSSRDSGVGEVTCSGMMEERHMSVDSCDSQMKTEDIVSERASGLRIKKGLVERLPENSFYFLRPNQYIFPGAEV